MDVDEFLQRYDAGEKSFKGINLGGAFLKNIELNYLELCEANLNRAGFAGGSLREVNLTKTSLIQARLDVRLIEHINLCGASVDEAKLHNSPLINSIDSTGTVHSYIRE